MTAPGPPRLRHVLLGIAVVLLLLFIIVPSVLRSRIQMPESESISLIRNMISAQAAYQSVTEGFYGTPRCLARPVDCIEGYAASGPFFLDAGMLKAVTDGNLLTFHAETAPTAPEHLKDALKGFALVAAPLVPGQTSVRSFCGDHTGRICQHLDGQIPRIHDAQCPSDCQDLQ